MGRPNKSADDDDDAIDLPDMEEPADGASAQTFSRCRLPKEHADMTDDDDPATQQLLGAQYDSDSEWDVEAVPVSPVEAEPMSCNAAEAEAERLMDAEIEMSTDMEFAEAE